MFSTCANCGENLIKVSYDPDDCRYRHADSKEYTCNLPPDTNGWYKNARPIFTKVEKEGHV